MGTSDLNARIGIEMLDGDRIHTSVGGSVGIDAGNAAYVWNTNSTKLGTLEISVASADKFDSFTAESTDKVKFSKGLEVGSKIEFLANGYRYPVGEIVERSGAGHIKIKIAEYGYGLGNVIQAIEYKNLADDISYTASKTIRFSLKSDSGLDLSAGVQLSVSTGTPITFYSRHDERIVGSDGNDVFNLAEANLNGSNSDSVDGRAGYDILNINTLNHGGDFLGLRNIEQINGTVGFDTITVSLEEYTALQVVDLKDDGALIVVADTLDLRGKSFFGVSQLYVGGPPKAVFPGNGQIETVYSKSVATVDNVEHAKMVHNTSLGGGQLIVTQGVLSAKDRALIYSHNITEIMSYESPAFRDAIGNNQKNVLRGTSKDNVLDGGPGADTLYGRGGRDVFMFSDALGKKNVDKVKDFKSKYDRIQLDSDVFTGLDEGKLSKSEFRLGSKAKDRDDHILYDQKTGKLYFDEDGSGRKAAVEFASLDHKPAISHHDFFIV
ncbi:calcium-binding protein [Microvirga pudoricolor]|uniref:calcium-binding protein n=1 Tax=Microvirga pudoricolor TaxID=2778729 RepID=UPI00194F397C|nr:calcium-binding protein [Microvirga pudoricolor]MBM6595939.1 hypothetical protein [Microvirga pudoricolor]